MTNEISNNLNALDNEDNYQDTIEAYNTFSRTLEQLKTLEDYDDLLDNGDITSVEAEAIQLMGADAFDDFTMEGIDWDQLRSRASSAVKGTAKFSAMVGRGIKTTTITGWDASRQLYDRYLISLENLREEIKDLNKTISELKDKESSESEITLRRETRVLSVGYQNLDSVKSLEDALTELLDVNQHVCIDWSKDILKLGENLIKVVGKNEDNVFDTTKLMIETLRDLDLDRLQKKLGMSRTELFGYKNIDVFKADPMINNKSLYCLRPDVKTADSKDPLMVLNGLRKRQFKLLGTKVKGIKKPKSKITVPTLTQSEMKSLIDKLDGILDVLEIYDRKSYSKSMEKTGIQLQNKLEKSKVNLFGDRTKAYINGIYKVSGAYLKLGTTPVNDLLITNTMVIRAALMYIKRSISTYR